MPAHYPVFLLAVTALMLTPGPNMALIVANSVAYGTRYGLLTLAGTASALSVHMLLVGAGLSEAMGVLAAAFEWVRWAGAAYLVVLGVMTWRAAGRAAAPGLDGVVAEVRSARGMVVRAFLVGLTNPKVLIFYAAFFPQFVAPERAAGPQLAVLCVSFVGLALVVDSGWAVAAARARRVLLAHGRLRNRVSGGLLVGAGLGLAAARVR